jgi:hypothetical protein
VGTLNGTYTVCWSLADRIPSTDVYGDTFAQIFAVRYFSRMETKDGIVDFIEWGWYDGDFGLESGFAKVVAGTGPFEDAFGTLSWPPRFPNLGGVVIYEGYRSGRWGLIQGPQDVDVDPRVQRHTTTSLQRVVDGRDVLRSGESTAM